MSVTSFAADALMTGDWRRLTAGTLTAIVTGSVLLLVAFALPGQLGLGDVNLAGALALSLGWLRWTTSVMSLLVAFGVQAVVALGLRVARRRSPTAYEEGMPMGPALVMAWLLMVLVSSDGG